MSGVRSLNITYSSTNEIQLGIYEFHLSGTDALINASNTQ